MYLCGGSRAYALDAASLRLLWTHGEASGEPPCPVAISAHQLLVKGPVHAAILDRTTGRLVAWPSLGSLDGVEDVLVSQEDFCVFGSSTSECAR